MPSIEELLVGVSVSCGVVGLACIAIGQYILLFA
ncbi:hypothetical protein SAMN06269185_3293 [Natronoarchaeum philippinense]|uniref:Uncharacterized protein n=1 Tax=Natronoarchaeum philippinense TaxID=558529 RepID=A0A285P901_NATPI|nr:hypothetical protein SAMN06269185_3293 [Natronoarchaeum philippinense]